MMASRSTFRTTFNAMLGKIGSRGTNTNNNFAYFTSVYRSSALLHLPISSFLLIYSPGSKCCSPVRPADTEILQNTEAGLHWNYSVLSAGLHNKNIHVPALLVYSQKPFTADEHNPAPGDRLRGVSASFFLALIQIRIRVPALQSALEPDIRQVSLWPNRVTRGANAD